MVAGYGTEQIFPAFAQVDVLGHVGDVLCVSNRKSNEVTHWSGSIILPLAQTSMIDVFTNGFGVSLWSIIRSNSRQMLDQVVEEFQTNGIAIPVALATTVTNAAHEEFMKGWMRKNWKELRPLGRRHFHVECGRNGTPCRDSFGLGITEGASNVTFRERGWSYRCGSYHQVRGVSLDKTKALLRRGTEFALRCTATALVGSVRGVRR